MFKQSVLVLGGYGNFGQRISRALAGDEDIEVVVAGRSTARARALADQLGPRTQSIALDHQSPQFQEYLQDLRPSVLIHTCGPFQGQDYGVAQACIQAGCHYVDIADGRKFVSGIGILDQGAQERGVLVASGASSLPALSSAVVDRYRSIFRRLQAIRHGISAGAKTPGIATMRAVMGYIGKPFERREKGRVRTVYGWQDLHSRRYPQPVGRRWLASCDVPDLELFPRRYPEVNTVTFHAGLGFATITLGTWGLSWLVRAGWPRSLEPFSARLHALASAVERFGTEWSAMHLELSGQGVDGQALTRTWYLLAGTAHGPSIPCLPAIALARKLVRGEIAQRGAMPCMGLLTVEEVLNAVPGLDLHVIEC